MSYPNDGDAAIEAIGMVIIFIILFVGTLAVAGMIYLATWGFGV